MQLIFERAADDRVIPFEEIAKAAHLPAESVELLVMRAMSLGLVKGAVDQVAEEATLSWVKPRMVEKARTQTMRTRLDE